MNNLKQYLFNKYGGFADKRIKNIEKGTIFIIDDRNISDFDARGQLYYWFCMIFVEVIDKDNIKVSLHCKTALTSQAGIDSEIIINSKNLSFLEKIAQKIENITKKKYNEKSFKYVCPRTAASLRRLKNYLTTYWT